MKPRKHRHKESFSVLLISNTGQNSRHFHISRSVLRLLTVFMLLVCTVFGWLMYQYLSGHMDGSVSVSRNANENATASESELLEQIAAQEEMVRQLEEEIETLNKQNATLTSENKALLEAAKVNMDTSKTDGEVQTTAEEEDSSVPSRYPYSEQGIISEKYSEDHPYVSIDTQDEGNIIAAGDGVISMLGSDDTYPLIIEIEHGNGYQTRYMFLQDAEALPAEGDQVQIGTVLATLDIHNLQLDYQVIFEGRPIDPLIVFEAKG